MRGGRYYDTVGALAGLCGKVDVDSCRCWREKKMSTATDTSEAAIITRLLKLDENELSPEAARFVLKINFPESDHVRMNDLAAKARAGTLTDAERQLLERYIHVGELLSLWHSKARGVLKRSGQSV